jgi:hypothetical protein
MVGCVKAHEVSSLSHTPFLNLSGCKVTYTQLFHAFILAAHTATVAVPAAAMQGATARTNCPFQFTQIEAAELGASSHVLMYKRRQ